MRKRKEVGDNSMKKYIARVFIPIVYEIEAENKQQAEKKAVEFFKQEDKKEKAVYFSNSWIDPEVEVEEIPAV
jgi:hypothetical protein